MLLSPAKRGLLFIGLGIALPGVCYSLMQTFVPAGHPEEYYAPFWKLLAALGFFGAILVLAGVVLLATSLAKYLRAPKK
jgi:hypothetical protein